MNAIRWFRRDAAGKAGQASPARVFSLGGMVTITVLLAVATALVAVPLRQTRERQMTAAAREQLPPLFEAIEAYRAVHYRFPDRIDELKASGYAAPPSIVVCRFRHVADVRAFEDHVEVALHHRAADRAITARYPSVMRPVERSIGEACAQPRTARAR